MRKFLLSRYVMSFCMGLLFLVPFIMPEFAHAEETQLQAGDDLQNALNKAKAGDTIKLSKGIYKGPIIIKNPVKLIGEKGATIDGGSVGRIITVSADEVIISGLTLKNSGHDQEDCGVYLEKTTSNHIENNVFKDVQFGIYIEDGKENVISGNEISSYRGHYSTRGNGVHIFKGEGNIIIENDIRNVQDGVYFDYAKNVTVKGNRVRDSRYALHFMFSENIYTEGNNVEGNVTGFMIMDSNRLKFYENRVFDQFHYRGYGILIYDSKDVILKENEILQNSVGISLEKAENTEIFNNIIAANQVGLEFRRENSNNIFSENNFMSNIVSSTIGNERLSLDDGKRGNYWDDYKSYDISGDGVGEIPYKAGSLYDNLLKRQPLWQFYFESPAMILWSKAESMFPSLGTVDVYDNKPLVEPVELKLNQENAENEAKPIVMVLAIAFIGVSLVIIMWGRRFR